MVVVGVYYQGCDVRASVATVYVTFIEWGQGGRPSAQLTTHFGDTESATGPRHHQTSPTPLCQQGWERESFTTFVVSTWLGLKLGRS